MYPPPQSNDRNEKKPDNDKPEMPDAMKDLLKTVREKKPCMTVIANGADPSPEELSMMLAMTMRDLMRDNKMLVSGGRTVMALYDAVKKGVLDFIAANKAGATADEVAKLAALVEMYSEPKRGAPVATCNKCHVVWNGPRAVAGNCPACGSDDVGRGIYNPDL